MSETLSNGVQLSNLGIAIGDDESESVYELAQKFNRLTSLVLTVNDRSIPNSDKPFFFEGGIETGDTSKFETIVASNISIDGSLEVTGGDQAVTLPDTLFTGSVTCEGSFTVGNNIEAKDTVRTDQLIANTISVKEVQLTEGEEVNVNGSRFINATKVPSRRDELVNKEYVDQRVQGIHFFENVRVTDQSDQLSSRSVKSLTDSDGNFNGKMESEGNTSLVIDTISLEQGDRILVNSFSGDDAYLNGIYEVTDSGSDSNPWAIERSEDFNSATSLNESDLVYVTSGEDNSASLFLFIRESPFTQEDVLTRSIYFTPYQINLSVFTDQAEVNDSIQQIKSDISRLEKSISRVQNMMIPEEVELAVGTVIFIASDSAPNNTFLPCDNSSYRIADYPDLYNLIGDRYSQSGDPSGEFRTPDARSRFLFSLDSDQSLGSVGGTRRLGLRVSQLPKRGINLTGEGHNHSYKAWQADSDGDYSAGNLDESLPLISDGWNNASNYSKITVSTAGSESKPKLSNLGSGEQVNNIPPYLGLRSYIKAFRKIQTQSLPTVKYFSFDKDTTITDLSASGSSIDAYIQLNTDGLDSDFLESVRLEVVEDFTNGVIYQKDDVRNFDEDDPMEITLRNLRIGDNRLSIRLSEPTVPESSRSFPISYRRVVSEIAEEEISIQVDPDCDFNLNSLIVDPETVSPNTTLTYRTQAEGVYHIRTKIYVLTDSDNPFVYQGAVSGDPETVACRQLLLVGNFKVPSTVKTGDKVALEVKYWSPANPSDSPFRVETVYRDVD